MNTKAIDKIKKLFSLKNRENIIIGDDVKIGKGNLILPGTNIVGKVKIGNNNIIGPYTTIGTPPQHIYYYQKGIDDSGISIKIGNENILREYTTIHAPTLRDTIIGNRCFLMAYTHVSHDTQLGNDVFLTNNTQIAGHTTIMDSAVVGLNTAIHQYSVIGSFAMIGMGSIITKDIPPFLTYKNYECYKINKIGMLRNGFTEEHIKYVYNYYTNDETPDKKILDVINEFKNNRDPNRNIVKISLNNGDN